MDAGAVIDLDVLGRLGPELEQAVDATEGIDPWCSGPDWVIPANRAFGADSELLVIGDVDHITGSPLDANRPQLALLARYRLANGRSSIAGLEPLWGFSSPLLTTEPAALGTLIADALRADDSWDQLIVPGLPPDGGLARAVGEPLVALGDAGLVAGITRQVADLGDGFECWLDRRRTRFRRNLRQASRRAEQAGIHLVTPEPAPALFDRLLDIEARSWKGPDGMLSPNMSAFYREIVGRLAERGRLLVTIARQRDRDIGFVLGGVRGGRYRGLQISFADEARRFSVGHLLQVNELRRLPDLGVHTYDLGMDMAYKQRWADRAEDSLMLVVRRR